MHKYFWPQISFLRSWFWQQPTYRFTHDKKHWWFWVSRFKMTWEVAWFFWVLILLGFITACMILCVDLIVDWIRYPIWGLGDPMVDTGLTPFCTRISGRYYSNQGPTPLNFCHQGTPRVPLTAVFAPAVVAGAHHLVVDDHVDALVAMPTFTLTIVNHGNVNHLKIIKKIS